MMNERRDKNGLTQEEYLRQYDPDKYPKPALTADIIIFREGTRGVACPQVLLIRRGGHPFLGYWAFPGGFAERDETLEMTAQRELEEETGITGLDLKHVGVYSTPGRDPRGWTVSSSYCVVVKPDQLQEKAGDDAADAVWAQIRMDEMGGWHLSFTREGQEVRLLPDERGHVLAFDHDDILRDAMHAAWDRLWK